MIELAERQIWRERGESEERGKQRVKSAGDLVSAFWALPIGRRRDVCERLELLDVDEMKLPEGPRYSLAFERAGGNGAVEPDARGSP